MKILIEESALDSIKRMAQEVQDQRDELLAALEDVVDRLVDRHESDESAVKARAAIARCQESTKVME